MVLSADGDHPMTRLSDTQLVILTAAAQRADLSVLPLPETLKLKGGALTKVMDTRPTAPRPRPCSPSRALYLSVAKLAAWGELGGGREPVGAWGERARG
jgi:hypothetical protein